MRILALLALAFAAGPAAAGRLVTTVATSRGAHGRPVVEVSVGEPGAEPVARFRLKQREDRVQIHPDRLGPGQTAHIGGGVRAAVLRVASVVDGVTHASEWTISARRPRRPGTRFARGRHYVDGARVGQERIDVGRRRVRHELKARRPDGPP